jgi:UDP-GlcNAc:undecaprenyl-phosphate GlcNAc-1-phosphate transferase
LREFITGSAFVIGGMFASLVCNALLLSFSQTLGIRNKNDIVIRWSNQSKPSLGGISFFVVFIFTTLAFAILESEQNIFQDKQYVGLLLAGTLAFLMGLADDAYNTKPLVKSGIQVLCGIILVLTDTQVDIVHVPVIDAVLTIIWVVGIMNSLNMLDNMDGITGTTVFFILLTCLIGSWIVFNLHSNIWVLTMLALIGGLLGFLFYNWYPSRIFMGDAGSQFIGLFVAFVSIKFLLNVGAYTKTESWSSVLLTLIAFTPAAVDTFTVTINRIKAGKSPLVGGKDHTTHHLVYAGFTDRQVGGIFALLGLVSFMLSCLMIYWIKKGHETTVLFVLPFFIFVFIYLYRNTIKYRPKDQVKE